MAFLTQNGAKNGITTLFFFKKKNANFFSENRQNSQKLVIITLTCHGGERTRT
jgi:hypothetical protein